MNSPKRILVTNDDGIDSPGVAALAAMVAEAGFVPVVVAPGMGNVALVVVEQLQAEPAVVARHNRPAELVLVLETDIQEQMVLLI